MSDEEIRAEIRSAYADAQKRTTELLLRVVALQTLLQQTGVFLQADVDQRESEIRTFWESREDLHLEELREKEVQEQLRRLLESYDGAKQ